jgi:hypothetical protein
MLYLFPSLVHEYWFLPQSWRRYQVSESACSNAILCMQYLTAFMFATYGSRLWQEYNKLVGSNRIPKYGWWIQRSCKQKNEYYVLLICRSSLLRYRESSKNIRLAFHYIRMLDRENLHHIYWRETSNKQHYFFIMSGHPTCYSVHTVNCFPWAKRPGLQAVHSPSSARVKYDGAISSLTHTCSWFGA